MADDEPVTSGGAQSSAALMMPVPARSGLEVTTEAMPAGLPAEGEATFGDHDSPPALATETTATGLTMAHPEHVTTAGVQINAAASGFGLGLGLGRPHPHHNPNLTRPTSTATARSTRRSSCAS